MFRRDDKKPELNFSTRAEAFNYMLAELLQKGEDPLEAAKKANEFAEIFSANMGIPLKVEPELKGVDKYISIAEKIGNYLEAHPKVLDYGIPLVTFVAGLFTGKKVEDIHQDKQNEQIPPQEPINFNEID